MSKYLVGKTILSMMIAEDRKALLFKTDASDCVAKCDDDKCDEFEAARIVSELINTLIRAYAVEVDNETQQDWFRVAGVKEAWQPV